MVNVTPKISVCCACYNRYDSLPMMIDSLLGQTGVDFEIILVNDGSPDPRVSEVLSQYKDSRVKVINQVNQGFVKAIRAAVAESQGEYIAIQGAGDLSLPGRLSEQAAVLDSDSRVGIVGCRRYETVYGGNAHGASVESPHIKSQPNLNDLVHGTNPFSHGEVMFRKSLYDQVGGYREYFRFAQDRDLWIRMAEHCDLYVVDKLLYKRYKFMDDGVSADSEKLFLQQALSAFARQCFYDRKKFGFDYVEKYGIHAGLFRRPQASFANAAAKVAVKHLFAGDIQSAHLFSQRARDEKLTLISFAVCKLVSLCVRSDAIKRFVMYFLGLHKNSKVWTYKQEKSGRE